MTKRLSCPYIVKSFSGTDGPISTKLGLYHCGLQHIHINYDSVMKIGSFYGKVNIGRFMTIIVKQVYWYISQISGERLQDHWSSSIEQFM